MATLTCTISGSGISGANNSRSITINDTDLQTVLNWANATLLQVAANQFNGGVTSGFTPTNSQLEWAWMQSSIVNATRQAVFNWQSQPVAATPITMT